MANLLTKLRLSELSLVDRPANKGARVTIFKRDDVTKKWDSVKDLPASVRSSLPVEAQRVYLSVANKQFASGADDAKAASIAWTAVKSGWRKEGDNWVRKAHNPDDRDTEENDDMTLEEQLKKMQDDIDKERAARITAEAVSKLLDSEREHYHGLPEADRPAFLKLDARGRREVIEKRDRDDETLTMGGTTIRKSVVGEGAFAFMKVQAAELTKAQDDIRKAREREERTVLVKRASVELAHLPGTDEVKADMLKAVEGIADEAVRKASLEALRAGNAAMHDRTRELGHGRPVAFAKAADQLEQLVKSFQDANKVSRAEAYDAVSTTAEGRRLYAEMEQEKTRAA